MDQTLSIIWELQRDVVPYITHLKDLSNLAKSHTLLRPICRQRIDELQWLKVMRHQTSASDIIRFFIQFLKGLVYFDYQRYEIQFVDQLITLTDYDVENIRDPQLHKIIKKYIKKYLSNGRWFDVIIVPQMTHLQMSNHDGFNPDERSHRGDVLLDQETPIAKKIKVECYDQDRDQIVDDDPDDKIFTIDEQTYVTTWHRHTLNHITWGDLMEGVMRVKGSKSDWWYELFTSCQVKMIDESFLIKLEFDHGS